MFEAITIYTDIKIRYHFMGGDKCIIQKITWGGDDRFRGVYTERFLPGNHLKSWKTHFPKRERAICQDVTLSKNG